MLISNYLPKSRHEDCSTEGTHSSPRGCFYLSQCQVASFWKQILRLTFITHISLFSHWKANLVNVYTQHTRDFNQSKTGLELKMFVPTTRWIQIVMMTTPEFWNNQTPWATWKISTGSVGLKHIWCYVLIMQRFGKRSTFSLDVWNKVSQRTEATPRNRSMSKLDLIWIKEQNGYRIFKEVNVSVWTGVWSHSGSVLTFSHDGCSAQLLWW